MTQATLYEVIAELAGLIAYTNQTIRVVAENDGYEQMAQRASIAEQHALDIQHQLQGEAGRFEATAMVDPFEAA
jgi:hypothetical protein